MNKNRYSMLVATIVLGAVFLPSILAHAAEWGTGGAPRVVRVERPEWWSPGRYRVVSESSLALESLQEMVPAPTEALSAPIVAIGSGTQTCVSDVRGCARSAGDLIVSSVVAPPATPTGSLTLSTPSCAIPIGERTCEVIATLDTQNTVNTPSITSNSPLYNFSLHGSFLRVTYPQTTFYLKDGDQTLDTKIAGANCADGGVWSADRCSVPAPSTISCSRSPSTESIAVGTMVTFTATPSSDVTGPYVFKNASGDSLQEGDSLTYRETYGALRDYSITVNSPGASGPAVCGPPFSIYDPSLCGGVSSSISAIPSYFSFSGTSRIRWSASGVSSCTITGTDGSVESSSSSGGSCPTLRGEIERRITARTTYCLVCDGNTAAEKCTTIKIGGILFEGF